MRHRILMSLVSVLLVLPATAALAEGRAVDGVAPRAATDVVAVDTRPTDVRPTDVRPTDVRPTDVRRDLRRCVDLERPVDCCRVVHPDVLTDRCRHDVPNLRALLWRAIQAHEWQLVVRILHALGII